MPQLRQLRRFVVGALVWLPFLLLVGICSPVATSDVDAAYSSSERAKSTAQIYNNFNIHNGNPKSRAHSTHPQGGDFITALNEFSSHEVIRPTLIEHGKPRRALRTTLVTVDGLHLPRLELSYRHAGRRVHIDLQRNDRLLPDEHFLRYQDASSPRGYAVQNFTKTEVALCHYQGSIRGTRDSRVAVSTCSGGINGIVFDGIDTYFIHSGSDGRLHDDHFLFRHADLFNKNATCGYTAHSEDDHYRQPPPAAKVDDGGGSEFNRILRYKRSGGEGVMIRGPYNANKHSSFVELVIVVDNKVYKSFGENTKRVHQHCKDLANIINALYVPLNIFVALVGVVIWNESNEIEFSSDGDVTLRNFLNYRRTKLVLDHPNDNAQLLTKEHFNGGVVGKALKGPICTHEYSGGVSMEHSPITAVVATTIAHEMGHNFGMEHDSLDCKCQDEKCIMSASSTSVVPVHWSSCSIDQLNIAFSRGMNYCLRNKPARLFNSPQCGNGFVEPGEQCDCGLPNYCENTCCDPFTCMLHPNASCATGECCDLNTCRPMVAGSPCRIADNDCDLPEYCTGESEYCPVDVFKRDTQECDGGQAFCFQGECRSHSNQCRILWGPTGESSEHCYDKNTVGNRGGNCGYNRLNNTFIVCAKQDVGCGMLHCRHLNERLEFGMESAAVLSHSFINHEGNIVACRTALVDLGLQSTDPGLSPNGAKCGNERMCVNQKCLAVAQLRANGMGRECADHCNENGVCNSRGNCHCDLGFAGPTCLLPGPGGSVDSGPATNPNSHESFQTFMYIFFFAVIPLMAVFCFLMYYCRSHPFFLGGKLAENIIKSAGGSKQSASRAHHPANAAQSAAGLPKSTPSSTDDMNSALLKSPSDSNDPTMTNGMFGKFKGFTLRPLNDTATPTSNLNGPNVAYVQPTVQDTVAANGGVPQRSAPPPPAGGDAPKLNGTLARKTPPAPVAAPALPPPNPGSHARPIISMPVLDSSTLSLPLKSVSGSDISPIRAAPTPPAGCTLKPAPPPPVPLHADSKLNVKRDGTIRRIASFLKKEEKPPVKEKTYIDREKLRNLEISSPLPMPGAPQGESSNSDSETTTPKEDETKNLVKRAQSMRSPTKKTNVQTFGSMRHPPGVVRPKSIVAGAATARPKSPPPRPPPLKKTNSTTSSGYQMPLSTAKALAENSYDDCECVELPLASIGELAKDAPSSGDNIYSVIDEIPPAAQTLKRSDLVSVSSSTTSDIGLLGEIVNEIEKRNGGDSIYSGSTLAKGKLLPKEEVLKEPHGDEKSIKAAEVTADASKTNAASASASASSYLRPAPLNAPVARVAPTRSDPSPSTAFSSFKPVPITTVIAGSNTRSTVQLIATTQHSRFNAGPSSSSTATVARNKSFDKTAAPTVAAAATSRPLPSATIQKPKPLSAKPSFSRNQRRTTVTAPTVATAPTAPRATTNIASLTQRFEKSAAAPSSSAGASTLRK